MKVQIGQSSVSQHEEVQIDQEVDTCHMETQESWVSDSWQRKVLTNQGHQDTKCQAFNEVLAAIKLSAQKTWKCEGFLAQ